MWYGFTMATLEDCLKHTKIRVFEIGDKIVHKMEPDVVCEVKSFVANSVLMYIADKNGPCFGSFSPKYWSKVQDQA